MTNYGVGDAVFGVYSIDGACYCLSTDKVTERTPIFKLPFTTSITCGVLFVKLLFERYPDFVG